MPPTRRRSGLSSSGLDSVIPAAAPAGEQPPAAGQDQPKNASTPAAEKPRTVKFGGYIDTEVAEQVRDALSALGGSWTTGALMEEALTREVERLAAEHNGGTPFPPRAEERLRTGPRIK